MNIISTENLLDYCLKNKKSLTPSRTLVIKTLSKHKKPISAYELRDEINNNGDVSINISQIYRVLDFWIDLGLVHKFLQSINFYCALLQKKNILIC